MAPTVYLISGANRGIGFALVQHLLSRDDVVVFAGVRDPTTSTELNNLAKRDHDKLHVVQLFSADVVNNRSVVENIKSVTGHLDVVIANAGICNNNQTASEASVENMQEHFTVNVLGPLTLFQASYPLLKASTSTPKFVPISSGSGSIARGTMIPHPQVEYGTSKAALNWVTRKIWVENDGLVAFPLCPGMVITEMSRSARESPVMQGLMKQIGAVIRTPEESALLVLEQIDAGTRETGFINLEGQQMLW